MPFSQYKKDLISYGIWRPVAEILSNPTWPSQKEWHAAAHANLSGRTLTASGTAVVADDGAMITYTSASDGSVTIPNDATSGWTGNHTLMIYQSGSGVCSFAAGSGVTLRNPTITTYQYGFLVARRVAANEWVVV